MRRRLWFSLAVLLQVAVLLFMIGSRWAVLAYGEKVLLKTMPVDPWDLFRGDYVTLNYEISELDLKTIPSAKEKYERNQTVYVVLEKDGRHWAAKSVSPYRPRKGELAIKGTVRYYYDWDKRLSVSYGIESYFVPQHEGRPIEAEMGSIDAEISIDSRGNAALSRLFFQGQEIKFR